MIDQDTDAFSYFIDILIEEPRAPVEELPVVNKYRAGWGSPRDAYDWLQVGRGDGVQRQEPRAYMPPPLVLALGWWCPLVWIGVAAALMEEKRVSSAH